MNILYNDLNINLNFEINDNITFIGGNSATGKTYLFNYLKDVISMYANDRNRDSECNCNVDLKRFKFFTVGDGDKLLNCLRTNNKYIYLIDRGEIFLTPEMIKLINNYRSTFICFSRNITGIKYRVSSYCELYSFEKNEVYYFTNKKINKNNNKSIKNPTVDDVLKMWKMA